MSKYGLIETEWPNFGLAEIPNLPNAFELQSRIESTYERMKKLNVSHLVIYADREHFANLHYLTNFDPRFEEALLILSLDKEPLLLVGNECEARLNICPLFVDGFLKAERYQSFSLISQPRNESRQIKDILITQGIKKDSYIGCVGWKYFEELEQADAIHSIEIPAFIVDALRDLTSKNQVINATNIFMSPSDGLKTNCSVSDIVYFEYTNILASEGMSNMIRHIEEGISDFELAQFFNYNGIPLNCHMTMSSADNEHIGLTGPTGVKVKRGMPFSSNFAYWGSNTSRCGWVAEDKLELPLEAQDYVEAFVIPYFEALNEWFKSLTIGSRGGDIYTMMMELLPYEKFQVFLNPGHLIHMDEWVSSPIYKGSNDIIQSGMAMQADVIPFNENYSSTRMEDGYVIADDSLQQKLKDYSIDCYARCIARREFMRNKLGLELPDEILPLSNMAGIVAPFLLSPNKIIGLI